MCEARQLPLTDWDLLLPEAVLEANARVNKSMKVSPFKCTFGMDPRLPADNFTGFPKTTTQVDPQLIQHNAKLSRDEAAKLYKEQYDRGTQLQQFSIGQRVLLKRTHGKNPKMSVRWVDGPYFIVKKIGPVNWAISDSSGKTKVYHSNLILPALVRQESHHTPSHNHYHTNVIPTVTHTPYPIPTAPNTEVTNPLNTAMADISNSMNIRRSSAIIVPDNLGTNNDLDISADSSQLNTLPSDIISNDNSLMDEHLNDSDIDTAPNFSMQNNTQDNIIVTDSGRVSRPVIGTRLIDNI